MPSAPTTSAARPPLPDDAYVALGAAAYALDRYNPDCAAAELSELDTATLAGLALVAGRTALLAQALSRRGDRELLDPDVVEVDDLDQVPTHSVRTCER